MLGNGPAEGDGEGDAEGDGEGDADGEGSTNFCDSEEGYSEFHQGVSEFFSALHAERKSPTIGMTKKRKDWGLFDFIHTYPLWN